MNRNEIEQMRARIAAAWGVDVSEVEYEALIYAAQTDSFTIELGANKIQWRPEVAWLLLKTTEDYMPAQIDMNAPVAHRFSVPITTLRLHFNAKEFFAIAHFLYCMGYDIQFLIDASVTVRAHDKLEWAQQMKEKGFALAK